MIGKSVSEISSDKDEFEKAKRNYNKGLAKVGFSEKIKYHKQSPVKRVLTRKVVWFNPPYSSSIKTNVWKIFIKRIVKHFPKHHIYYQIFDNTTIKLSYSCMPNMENILIKHNNKLIFQSFEQPTKCVMVKTKQAF